MTVWVIEELHPNSILLGLKLPEIPHGIMPRCIQFLKEIIKDD
jgi:hypothetical protein|tara:strand:+ start:182 stop:310 length:129 start_codon:yes stop_codon:yes gene_type:complete